MGWTFRCYGISCAALKINLPPQKVSDLYALNDDEKGFVSENDQGEFCFSLPDNCLWTRTDQSDTDGFVTSGSVGNHKMMKFFSEVKHKSYENGIICRWRINPGITIFKQEDIVFDFKGLHRLAGVLEQKGGTDWSEPEYEEWFQRFVGAFACGYRDGVVCVEWV
jgi:hypothetical protein